MRMREGACAILLAGLALASCGGEPSDEQQVRDAIRRTQEAFDSKSLAGVCSSLTAAARKHVTNAGHGSGGRCVEDLQDIAGLIREARGQGAATSHRILSVQVHGDRATAIVAFGKGLEGSVPVAREDGKWKVDALYGGMPAERQDDKF